MTDSDNKRLLAALEANWQAEMEGHYTYSALAKRENDPQRRNALRGLAAAEKHHAGLWAGRILELGGQVQYTGDESGQADSLATRVGGADLALRRLEIDEGRDIAKYGKQLKALGDEPSIAILMEVIADEREHYQTLGNLIRSRRPCLQCLLSKRRKSSIVSSTPGKKAIRKRQVGLVMPYTA
jgi:vacuolar iron transporter family protein